ncbi:MAG: exodeoxyribonuclease VII large subunit [Chloroflexota bacterium]|nr:exodeoxyribonuclease VII large subunit [Chloroflexota bacterium]
MLYTVHQVTTYIKESFESDMLLSDLYVAGEVSNLRLSASGHSYFTLKDSESVLNCVMFKGKTGSRLLDNGVSVSTHGRISFYEPRGSTDFIVDLVMAEGSGALSLEFENLRLRLESEGLFDQSRKRVLPEFPKVIGVVTSTSGAVLHDIQSVIARRYPLVEIVISPTLVQGENAAINIGQAINDLNDDGRSDVIVVARGGGSIEELWPFNEEIVARAIYASRIPVVSAIGHETDITISDWVSDLRAPTPSAAAELIVPDATRLKINLSEYRNKFFALTSNLVESVRSDIDRARRNLQGYLPNLQFLRRNVDDSSRAIGSSFKHQLDVSSLRLDNLVKRLLALNPDATLRRGFAAIHDTNGILITSAHNIKSGDLLNLDLVDGAITAKVTGKTTDEIES